ncbi:MAG: cysteine desulfurase CsdA [Bacteroidetes bacterium]|nr:MAG: cysteine desulfurase CsdA [Bacteroidota bacterium]
MLDIEKVRSDFPTLHQKVHNLPLVYLDNGATTQKPQVVIDRVRRYYENENSNVHRGVHYLSQEATSRHEEARVIIQEFINASQSKEIIFTKGTTESINMVSAGFAKKFLNEGDEIIVSEMEHHANIVPWQIACEEKGAMLKVIPIFDDGSLDMEAYKDLLSDKTKMVAIAHISNVMGIINPIKELINLAHKRNIPVLVDGAQGVTHTKVDVQDLDCDFYVFSSHKLFAPMGIGVLYGKESWLEKLPPYQFGGEMIKQVSFEKTTYNELPFKFEAGTPNVAGALGLATAIEYINEIGMDEIEAYENDLLTYATEKLSEIDGLKIIGTHAQKVSVISFVFDDIHHYDAGTILDQLGIAVRTGNHCAQPLMKRFGVSGSIRAAFAFYNTREEIDILIAAINRMRQMFA